MTHATAALALGALLAPGEALTGVGLAAGINFRSGAYDAGADVRKQSTGSKNGIDLDPLTWGVKLGVNF